ncbi:MAG: 16S rRNA (uracil(1498)-N(3))-methyltransferase [Lachnospiraceae bacterium]|nr:16S rRNA (uracil(1498)-N(3))-methyltransferase [Lachnospiraceae bacterium]
MYRFFVDPANICGDDIYIEGEDVNHIKNVLRMRIGEEVSVVAYNDSTDGASSAGPEDTDGKEYRCEVADFEDERVHLKLRFIKEDNVELPNKIYLLQGLPKGDKMELIIQKAVELGVYEIIPVSMKRCVVRYDGKKGPAKVSRFNAICESAAKQSKRGIIPKVTDIMSFDDAVKYCRDMEVKLMPYELADMNGMDKTRELIGNIEPGQSVAVFIGPEGGFAKEETDAAEEGGFEEITLGHRILRTETAGMTVLSWLVYMLEG